jgi:AbrB family looped-hinge helix DNA binding protein
MTTPRSRVTTQGQISVPAEIRRKLGIGPGSVLEWDEQGGEVVVRRLGDYTSAEIHSALFASRPKRRTLEELKRGIGRYVKRRHARR